MTTATCQYHYIPCMRSQKWTHRCPLHFLDLCHLFPLRKNIDIADAADMYPDDLPSLELISQELLRWKLKWQRKSQNSEAVPATYATAIGACNSVLFPRMFNDMLLKVACTHSPSWQAVPFCKCERSASTRRPR